MALWGKTIKLPPEAIKNVQHTYNVHRFPIEVRHYFADWIEEKPWKEIDDSNPAYDDHATELLQNLVDQLRDKAGKSSDFERLKFQDFAKQFEDMYQSQPLGLVKVIKACLATEEQMVKIAESPSEVVSTTMEFSRTDEVTNQIMKEIEALRRYTEHTEQALKDMQAKQEQFVIDYQTQSAVSSKLNLLMQQPSDTNSELRKMLGAQKEVMNRQLLDAAQKLLQSRIELANKHKECLQGLELLQKKVVDEELINWKRRQQLAGNGAVFDTSHIESLQKWCEALAEMLWANRTQIIKVDILRKQLPIEIPQGVLDVQPELNTIVTALLSSLVTSTFIVETQPPQVLKTNSRFTSTVRLLVGGKLNLHMSPPLVEATIISEMQARGLMASDEQKRHQKSGDILNHKGSMEYHPHTGQLSITFRNMSLKTIKRADRKGSETVAEEKFCILFSSRFDVGGNELNFQVWTLSLPVIVTVHGNQECQATATYLWDNQFSESGRIPFQVPDSVPWSELAVMLSTKFQGMTGRGLSESNLKYLASKVYDGPAPDGAMISWSQFNRENLNGRSFTFWQWFYEVAKLVKDNLKSHWMDGSIQGFMDRMEPQEKLLPRPHGTFLLRFSDKTLGGVTIAWVSVPESDERKVWNLQPFTNKDFCIRSLADRVKDLTTLVTLYPDIPKDVAFSKYYSPPIADSVRQSLVQDGYVPSGIVTVIDTSIQGAGAYNYDAGPNSPAVSSYSNNPLSPRRDDLMDIILEDNDHDHALSTDYAIDDFNMLNLQLLTQQAKPEFPTHSG